MAAQSIRIAGVDLPREKRVIIALQSIFGIGPARAAKTCAAANIPAERRTKDLTEDEARVMRDYITDNYKVEGELRADVRSNIKRLQDLGCYRGQRHRRGLPVRGQRTHTNARTRKGPAKPIAGKKKAV